MTEQFRPQYHVTPEREWMNDLQRPLYINGQHHLYYLYNKDYSTDGEGTEWAHAVSTDLVNWERKGVAIPKYTDSAGDSWSGSAVVDENNTAGFGAGAIVAILTMAEPTYQCNHLWYSTDGGNSFTHYGTEPIMPNPTGHSDFRDPKVIWHEPTQKWVMLMAEENKVGFYISPNLKNWTYVSGFFRDDVGVMECPNLFQINIDDDSNQKKWVLLVGGNAYQYGGFTGAFYFVGSFDGTTFTPETNIKWIEQGADSYAGVTWDAPYCNGNYRYFMSWMSNWAYACKVPHEGFTGNASIVRELRLKTTVEGIKLVQAPVWNLKDHFEEIAYFSDLYVSENGDLILRDLTSYCIEASIAIDGSTQGKFGFALRDGDGEHTDLSYDHSIKELVFNRSSSGNIVDVPEFTMPQKVKINTDKDNCKLKIEIFVDRSTVEVFINNGEYVMSNIVFPKLTSNSVRLWSDQVLHVDYLKVKKLRATTIS